MFLTTTIQSVDFLPDPLKILGNIRIDAWQATRIAILVAPGDYAAEIFLIAPTVMAR